MFSYSISREVVYCNGLEDYGTVTVVTVGIRNSYMYMYPVQYLCTKNIMSVGSRRERTRRALSPRLCDVDTQRRTVYSTGAGTGGTVREAGALRGPCCLCSHCFAVRRDDAAGRRRCDPSASAAWLLRLCWQLGGGRLRHAWPAGGCELAKRVRSHVSRAEQLRRIHLATRRAALLVAPLRARESTQARPGSD